MVNRWRNSGNMSDFIFGGSKITAGGDCSHEIKRHLLLGRKVMTNLDSILKSRDIILPTKVRLVKAMVFPVVMYGCESWTVNKAERWRIDAFLCVCKYYFFLWYYTCFNAILPNHPTPALSHRVQKTVLYIYVSFAVLHTGLSWTDSFDWQLQAT